jgi:WD40 repeat protein
LRADNWFLLSVLTLAGIASVYGSDWVFSGGITGGHREPVSAIIHKGDTIISVGKDGFLGIWDARTGAVGGRTRTNGQAAVRFQISPYSITTMAERPGTNELCIVESDNLGLYRISVWNYRERRNIFTLRFTDPISHIAYSMGGNFIIAARTGRTGLIFIDSATGELLQSPQSLTGTIGLAVTGRSERTMLVYLTSGALSYWDLESGSETGRFNVPANLNSPVLFSNSRYFAGTNADAHQGRQGLVVIHAASGEILAWDDSIPGGSPLCVAGDDLICLVQNRDTGAELYRYTVDRAGHLVKSANIGIPESENFTAIAASTANTAIALGTSSGSLTLAGTDGRLRPFTVNDQTRIVEAAVSGSTIAFLAEDGTLSFIPLNYSQLSAQTNIGRERNEAAYNHITAFAGEDGSTGQFILWQDRNTRTQPVIRSSDTDSHLPVPANSQLRFPIRSVASFGGRILFIDTAGNLSVVSPFVTGRNNSFTFFTVGLMDAGFIDRDRILIGRSAVSGSAPFMVININTGETLPLPHPSQAAAMVHRGASDNVYAVAISSTDETRTSILHVNLDNIADSIRLVDFQEEDTQFSIAESSGRLAATIGGEGAAIYSSSGMQWLERTPGLPLKLIDGGSSLISLDRDGNICWHDSVNGKLLAVFRLHQNGWALQTERRTISGRYSQ